MSVRACRTTGWLRNSSFVFRDAVFQRLRETVRRVKKNRACGRGEI
jgi:hypothetical protein